jgi:hypothetical protein
MSSSLSRLIRPIVLVLFIAGVLLLGAGSQSWATPAQGPFGQTVPSPTATTETITGGGGEGDGDAIPIATLQIVTPVAPTGLAPTATITPTGTMIPPATAVPPTPVVEVTPTVPVPATLPVTGAPPTPFYVPMAWIIILLLLAGLALTWNARRHPPA